MKRGPTPSEGQSNQDREKAQAQQGGETYHRGVAEDDSPLFRAKPQGIAGEPYREIEDACGRRNMTVAAALVHVPELRLPGT